MAEENVSYDEGNSDVTGNDVSYEEDNSNVTGNDISYEDLSKLAEDYKLMENDLDILVEYSLIIPRDIHTNKLFIKYREKVPTRKKTRYFYGLHKVLMLYFNAMQ